MNDKESTQHIRFRFDPTNRLLDHDQFDLNYRAGLLSDSMHLNDNYKASQKIGEPIDEIHLKDFEFIKDVEEHSNLPVILKMLDAYQKQSAVSTSVPFFQNYQHDKKEESDWICTIMKYDQRLDKLFCIDFDVKQFDVYSNKMQRIIEEEAFKNKNLFLYDSLTKREKEILRLISLGESNQQISELLFLSKDTVRTHRNHIWKKLKINNLVDAIKYAQAFDLI